MSETPINGENILGEKFVESELPVFMHKSGEPTLIGKATVTKFEDRSEIRIDVVRPEAQEFVGLLQSGVVEGLTIGGFVNRKMTAGLN